MAIIVNGQPRKTSYIARIYPLSEDEEEVARMRSLRVVASDDNPVVTEIQEISKEERNRLRNGNTGWCYIDMVAQLDEKIEGPTISTCELPIFTYWVD